MNTTPEKRFAQMEAMPTHVVYMTRGGGRALITQSYCEIISQTDQKVIFRTVTGERSIPAKDVFAVKTGRLSQSEMDEVFANHGHKQNR